MELWKSLSIRTESLCIFSFFPWTLENWSSPGAGGLFQKIEFRKYWRVGLNGLEDPTYGINIWTNGWDRLKWWGVIKRCWIRRILVVFFFFFLGN